MTKRTKMLIMAAAAALLHTILYFVFGMGKYSEVTDTFPFYLIIISSVILVLEVAFVIFSRIKMYGIHLKGLFMYKFFVMMIFALEWIAKLASNTAVTFFDRAFIFFTVEYRPLARFFYPIIGMSEFYSRAVIFGLFAAVLAGIVNSYTRQRKFEREMVEKNSFNS